MTIGILARLYGRKETQQRPAALAVQSNGAKAEITLYGEIVPEWPLNPWTGERIDGQYIALDDFLKVLEELPDDLAELTVRIHSLGGDCYTALTIHNRLNSLPAKVNVIVDGVAMSGGSIIMCAGDEVSVFPGSLVMIHNCRGIMFGYYTADELRQEAEEFDAANRAMREIYRAKTGLDAEKLNEMMAATTTMTGREAVDMGFADKLIEDEAPVKVAASADRKTLYVGGYPVWQTAAEGGAAALAGLPVIDHQPAKGRGWSLDNGMSAAMHTPAAAGELAAVVHETLKKQKKESEEEEKLEIKTTEELRAAYPELVSDIEAAASASATNAERKRIQEIEQVGALFDANLVSAAKFDEKSICSASDLTLRAAMQAAAAGQQFLTAMQLDANASGVGSVPAAASPEPGDPGSLDDDADLTPDQLMAEARRHLDKVLPKEKKD